MTDLDPQKIPKHVAIIMDGNRRWAAQRGLPAFAGHKRVVDSVIEDLIQRAGELGIEYITLWAWSSENWTRPTKEVGGVMKLFRYALKHKAKQMIQKGARLRVIGDANAFDPDIKKGIDEMIEVSKDNTKITVTFALNYGGRNEILRSVQKTVEEILRLRQASAQDDQDLDFLRQKLVSNLDTAGMPDPDLIIRPGGTKRLSGFLLWQAEYAELYFTDVLMPDFNVSELDKALADYQTRERRFGGGNFKDYQKKC